MNRTFQWPCTAFINKPNVIFTFTGSLRCRRNNCWVCASKAQAHETWLGTSLSREAAGHPLLFRIGAWPPWMNFVGSHCEQESARTAASDIPVQQLMCRATPSFPCSMVTTPLWACSWCCCSACPVIVALHPAAKPRQPMTAPSASSRGEGEKGRKRRVETPSASFAISSEPDPHPSLPLALPLPRVHSPPPASHQPRITQGPRSAPAAECISCPGRCLTWTDRRLSLLARVGIRNLECC